MQIEDALIETLGRRPAVVSTIDHPFPSPPIQLLDGHLKLHRRFGLGVLALNWDVSHADERRYRYDLVSDTGLLAKNPVLYHYEPGIPYDGQLYARAALAALDSSLPVAIDEIRRRRRDLRSSSHELLSRASTVVAIAREASNPSQVPAAVTCRLLRAYYQLLKLPHLDEFVAATHVAYSQSSLLTQWIPWCLRNVSGVLSFDRLDAAGLFERTPFRLRSGAPPLAVARWAADEAAPLLESRHVVASLDVCLWSLAIAGVPHFGDDRDFFRRLTDHVGDQKYLGLQLTDKGTDCARFLELSEDIGVLVDIADGEARISHRTNHPTKHTRRSTFSALYVALGGALQQLLAKYNDELFVPTTVGYNGQG